MLHNKVIAYLDKGLLNFATWNIEQSSQHYGEGEQNVNRLPRPKEQHLEHRNTQKRQHNADYANHQSKSNHCTNQAHKFWQKVMDLRKSGNSYLPDHVNHQSTDDCADGGERHKYSFLRFKDSFFHNI